MQTSESTLNDGIWVENPARVPGIFWSYILPAAVGSVVVVLLGGYLLASRAPSFIVAAYALSYILGFGLIGRAIAREPRAVVISEGGLKLRYGVHKPWHEIGVRWEEVERFTMGFGLGAPVLIAYFRARGKRGLGFMQREIVRNIVIAHSKGLRKT